MEAQHYLHIGFQDIFAKFQLKDDPEYNQTKAIAGTSNPDWKLEKIYSFKPLTAEVSGTVMSLRLFVPRIMVTLFHEISYRLCPSVFFYYSLFDFGSS